MKAVVVRIVNWLAYIALGASYCLVLYMFVFDDTFLDNWISRTTALIDIAGAVGFLSLRKYVKKTLPQSLWVVAFVILAAAVMQALAMLPMHRVLVRVDVIGEKGTVTTNDIHVRLLHTDHEPKPRIPDTIDAEGRLLFRSRGRVLTWNKPEVAVVTGPTSAVDSSTVEWSPGSIWDFAGERVIDLQLKLNYIWVSIEANPRTARIRMITYSEQDTTDHGEFSDSQPRLVGIGERILIHAAERGYYNKTFNFDLKQITRDTVIHISLESKPADVMLEAFNIGGEPESTAVVVLNSEPTLHRAFERFALPWGEAHVVCAELVTASGYRFQSEPQIIRPRAGTLNTVTCTLQVVN